MGRVPADWKTEIVTLIFKKGFKEVLGNCRPVLIVSLTLVCCKMMESILRDAVTEHLDLNKLIILNASQHGFSKGRSCATNLLEFLEKGTTVRWWTIGQAMLDFIFSPRDQRKSPLMDCRLAEEKNTADGPEQQLF